MVIPWRMNENRAVRTVTARCAQNNGPIIRFFMLRIESTKPIKWWGLRLNSLRVPSIVGGWEEEVRALLF